MVSSFVIAEGEQRTPEGYESRLRPLDCFFGFPTSYVESLLLRQAAEEGGRYGDPLRVCAADRDGGRG